MIELRALDPGAEQLLIDLRARWAEHASRALPMDRAAAQAAIEQVHADALLPAPTRWLWVQSPVEGIAAAHILHGVRASTGKRVRHTAALALQRIGYRAHETVTARVNRPVRSADGSRLVNVISRRASEALEAAWPRVHLELAPRIAELVGRRVEPAPFRARSAQWPPEPCGRGHMDRELATRLDFFGRMGLIGSHDAGWLAVIRNCGWWWVFEEVCVVAAPPTSFTFDREGRLHGEVGRALEYPDGWGSYAWHGTEVEAAVVLAPETLDPAAILREANVEVRRVQLERFGMERLVEVSGAAIVHEEDGRSLFRIPQPADEPIVVVRVQCPSTGRRYFLRVPPDTASCAAAVAWTFGVPEREYRPLQES